MKYAKDMYMLKNFDPCGRFCQQAVEKRLKYYIEHNGTTEDLRILHIHSLAKLYARVCELSGTEVDKAIRGDLHQLTTYYFDTNYPCEENIELTDEMAKEALEIAERVNSLVDSLREGSND